MLAKLWCHKLCAVFLTILYNNHIIANGLQSVSVKEFWKFVNNWRRYGQK